MNFLIKNIKETKKFAKIISYYLNDKDIIFLTGNLGAGKTEFTRFIVNSLFMNNELIVSSPTYTLMNLYENSKNENKNNIKNIIHCDFYRLSNKEEIDEIGFYDFAFHKKYLSIVEWPKNFFNHILNNATEYNSNEYDKFKKNIKKQLILDEKLITKEQIDYNKNLNQNKFINIYQINITIPSIKNTENNIDNNIGNNTKKNNKIENDTENNIRNINIRVFTI